MLADFASIANDPERAATRISNISTIADILSIALNVLARELALARGPADAAFGHFEDVLRVEHAVTYTEPSEGYMPARHNLGAALLAAGRAPEAEAVYRNEGGLSLERLVPAGSEAEPAGPGQTGRR